MNQFLKKISAKIFPATTLALFAFVLGALIAYAGPWTNPTAAPPGQNIGAPLTPIAPSQIKTGGLILNNILNNLRGLVVLSGPLVLAPNSTTPEERLHLLGNLRISGIIMPNGNSGDPSVTPAQTLTKTATGMNWENRGWMTIAGGWSPDYHCSGASPALCAAFGYHDYATYCFGGALGYSVLVRVCRE